MKKIFECYFGSQMYGTNTPSSDTDIKGIYISSLEEIVLNKSLPVIVTKTKNDYSQKNTKDDIDIEYKELRTFLREASEGQTYALDMLFCPEKSILINSEIWKEIQNNRLKLISKQCKPILGYVTGQCAKYAMKGSRLDAVEKALEWAKSKDRNVKIGEVVSDFPEVSQEVDGIKHIISQKDFNIKCKVNGRDVDQTFISVCGMKFDYKVKIKLMIDSLTLFLEKFGSRSYDAKNNKGIDWKAVSHAVRLLLQTQELAETGFITFPLKEKDFVLQIKKGELSWDWVNNWVSENIDKSFNMIKNSKFLLDKPDYYWIEKFTIKTYFNE